jgi:hypothetical protein
MNIFCSCLRGLYVRQEHECQESLLEDVLKGFTDLKLVVQRTVMGSLWLKIKKNVVG